MFNLRSSKTQIALYASLWLLITACLTGFAGYEYFKNLLENKIKDYSASIVASRKIGIDSYFKQIKTIMQIAASNEIILNSVENYESMTDIQKLNSDRTITAYLIDIMKFNNDIKDIIVVGKNGAVYYSSGAVVIKDYNFYSKPWFPKNDMQYSKVTFIGLYEQDYYYSDSGRQVISAVIPVINFMKGNRKVLGAIICNMDVEKIMELYKDSSSANSELLLVVDTNNRLINRRVETLIDEEFYGELTTKIGASQSGSNIFKHKNNDIVSVHSTSEITNWKIISLTPLENVMGNLNKIVTNLILLLIAANIVFVVIESLLISIRIAKPVSRLMTKMGAIEKGRFDVKLYDNSSMEIEALSSRMDTMIEQINRLNRDLYSYQIISRDATIKSLQSQINPHFLFNTLQTIKAMAVCGQTADISGMVTLIGDILRYATYHAQELVNIEDEIRYVADYLQIQSSRYPGKFSFSYNCSGELRKHKIIKLIIQPIVENSVNHGLQNSEKEDIRINVYSEYNKVFIDVSDNGCGIPEKRLKQVREMLYSPDNMDNSSSIGLKNVHERIKLKFGGEYGLQIFSAPFEGTLVRIVIPALKGGCDDENGNGG